MGDQAKQPEAINPPTNPTQSDIQPAKTTEKKPSKEERAEQARTAAKKKLFLRWWQESACVVGVVCKKVDINRDTYYTWRREDPEFARAVDGMEINKNEVLRDHLWYMASVQKNIRAITYWLDRRDPLFKPKRLEEVVTGDKTIEDLLAEGAQRRKTELERRELEKNGSKRETTISQPDAGQPGTDRDATADQKQAGDQSAVPAQPSATTLLGEQDPAQLDPQS